MSRNGSSSDESPPLASAIKGREFSPGRKRRPGGGRKRNPAIDARIIAAGREVYSRDGWAGFTVDAVAKAAGVSRDAVNRRYPDLADLLHGVCVNGQPPALTLESAGDVREVVYKHSVALYDYFASGEGPLLLRMHLEAKRFPAVYRSYRDNVTDPGRREMQATLTRMLADTEYPPSDEDVAIFIEMVTGAVLMHALTNQATEGDSDRTAVARESLRLLLEQAFKTLEPQCSCTRTS
ncbi:TetR family transcriptional regulator [Gordonia terrae]